MRAEARRGVAALVLLAGLAGCDSLEFAGLSEAGKITQAFPPSAEVRVAHERLRELHAGDPARLAVEEDEFADRLELRALECAEGLDIGRFDSPEEVKQLGVRRDCLQAHDTRLLRFLASRQIAWRLAQPPLRTFDPLGPPVAVGAGGLASISNIDAASAAGVALVRDGRGTMQVIEIPSGTTISSIPGASGIHAPNLPVSPNGRLAAYTTGHLDGVAVIELETGEKLWQSSEIGQLLAWLPAQSAAVVQTARGSGSATSLLDLQRGVIEPLPAGVPRAGWIIPLGADGSQWLAGSGRAFSKLEISRESGALEVRVLDSFHLAQGEGVTSSWPTSMRNGKAIVFVTGRDLMMFDLQTREETLWKVTDRAQNRYAKLGESTILLDAYGDGPAGMGGSARVLDIDAGTLAPATGPGQQGLLHALGGRTGFARSQHSRRVNWLGDTVATGTAIPVDDAFAEIDRLRQSRLPAAAPVALVAVPSPPPFAALASEARVQAIGVYEGKDAVHGHGRERSAGRVSVSVHGGGKPVVLVLASYEPVEWNVILLPGARLAAVLHGGYYPSRIAGVGSAPRHDLGQVYCHEASKCEALEQEVRRVTGRGIDRFQGRYEGAEFTVSTY